MSNQEAERLILRILMVGVLLLSFVVGYRLSDITDQLKALKAKTACSCSCSDCSGRIPVSPNEVYVGDRRVK